jgi:fibronectin-binding autotransporter adhesin
MSTYAKKIFSIGFMLLALVMSLSSAALAGNVLVTELPWGYDGGANMAAVFGAGNFTEYTSYASANPAAIFTASNRFVMLEGGWDTDTHWSSYLTANSGTILSWVNAGGRLLLQSAGKEGGTYTFGPGSLIMDATYWNACYDGTLTAAGIVAFPNTPVAQSGNWLSHDYITGTGLTNFMNGLNGDNADVMILAGTNYGAGYIMYSGLTAPNWNTSGDSLLGDRLLTDAIAYTAAPIPGAVWLLGSGLLGLAGLRRKFKR